jgi:hypothetical protein
MKTFSSLLVVTRKGTKGACQAKYSAASVPMCIACAKCAIWKGALYSLANWKPRGPDLLDKLLKDFIVNHADLPQKWVKRLATSGERVNHDSRWKCTTSAECKTGISVVLMVMIGIGPLWNRWSLVVNCLCYSSFMFTWSCAFVGLW